MDLEKRKEIEAASAENEGGVIAVVAYLWIIGLVIAIVMNLKKKNAFANFHIRQMVYLCSIQILSYLILELYYENVMVLIYIWLALCWFYGIHSAIKGRIASVLALIEKNNGRFRVKLFILFGLLSIPTFYYWMATPPKPGLLWALSRFETVFDRFEDAFVMIIFVIVFASIGGILEYVISKKQNTNNSVVSSQN
ncbi:hypothetical protein DF185_13605 [Marinifilum breve]|uniref:Uncharacterized protein n=1 Tax=Marinifilum breve TaxID=2184082 RepID=A0A2V3ZZF2_9BACT|nr:hypothetical protein [Marinifilum breve]PXY00927.1 hypothetical protein DF185_13605 [Marinifilum breve]